MKFLREVWSREYSFDVTLSAEEAQCVASLKCFEGEAERWGLVLWVSRIEDLSNLTSDCLQGVWFAYEKQVLVHHTVPHDDVFGVAGGEEHQDGWAGESDAFSQFASVHSWHDDVG